MGSPRPQRAGPPGIAGFANGPSSDVDAVTAGLTLPTARALWKAKSTRLKVINRQCKCAGWGPVSKVGLLRPASTWSARQLALQRQ
jgi:hypothetical protein